MDNNILIETIEETKVVYLSGIINALTVPDIQIKLIDMVQINDDFVIEMSNVDLISSVGMLMLLNLHREMKDQHQKVILGGLSEPVKITLSTMGFSSFLITFDTLEEAIAFLQSDG